MIDEVQENEQVLFSEDIAVRRIVSYDSMQPVFINI